MLAVLLFCRNILISKLDVPKIEIGLFQYIEWESLFSLQWLNLYSFN